MKTTSSPTKASNRAEQFALLMAIIGLIANLSTIIASVITIVQASGNVQMQANGLPQGFSVLELLKPLSVIILIYCWFVFSWFLIRRYFLIWVVGYDQNTSRPYDEVRYNRRFSVRVILTIIGIGLILFPLFIVTMPESTPALLYLPIPIWIVHAFLMPIIYPADMDREGLFTSFD